jgi:DNA/RNA-binding domain of Phe-tRNA-synthetase-like protein
VVFDAIHPAVDVEAVVTLWYQRARSRLAKQSESQMPEVIAWRQAYSQMGLKPTKYRSAAEALLRRFRRENDLPRLHPLVDYCNALSLASALPVAVFDLNKVAEYIEVRHASGTETHLAFNGDIEHPARGEVILCDAQNHAHGRRWTFRQSRQSTITPETTKVLILSEAMHPTAAIDVPALIDQLAEGIAALWSPCRSKGFLTSHTTLIEF